MSDFVGIALLVLSLVVLFALSTAETALLSISRSRAKGLLEDDVRGADVLVDQIGHRIRLVSPILLFALAAQLTAAAVVTVLVRRWWGGGWVPLGLAALLVVMFVVTEAVPKTWAIRNIDRAAITAARFTRVLARVPPVRWLTGALAGMAGLVIRGSAPSASLVASEEEIVALADAAVQADVLDDTEGEFIQSIVSFGDTIVREAMVPRPDVLAAAATTTVDAAIEMLVDRGVSRMPVFGADIDDIQGIVHIKDLFARVQRGRGNHFVSIAQRKPFFVPETKRAAELLAELKGVPDSMVVVIDEYGGTAGIVTMEDLIEEILGDIVDEFDTAEEPLLEPLHRGEWRVHGRMPVDEFNALIGAELPDDDWDTVGGLIFDALGRVPGEGESIIESGYRLTVEQIEGRRITRVRVIEATAAEPEPDEPPIPDQEGDLVEPTPSAGTE